jgi:hypothetical protein
MMIADEFRSLALSLPEAVEQAHFERASFRVRGKIFATLKGDQAVLKLAVEEQTALVAADPDTFFLPGWNHQGWTGVRLGQADPAEIEALLETAWRNVAPKKLVRAQEKKDLP